MPNEKYRSQFLTEKKNTKIKITIFQPYRDNFYRKQIQKFEKEFTKYYLETSKNLWIQNYHCSFFNSKIGKKRQFETFNKIRMINYNAWVKQS